MLVPANGEKASDVPNAPAKVLEAHADLPASSASPLRPAEARIETAGSQLSESSPTPPAAQQQATDQSRLPTVAATGAPEIEPQAVALTVLGSPTIPVPVVPPQTTPQGVSPTLSGQSKVSGKLGTELRTVLTAPAAMVHAQGAASLPSQTSPVDASAAATQKPGTGAARVTDRGSSATHEVHKADTDDHDASAAKMSSATNPSAAPVSINAGWANAPTPPSGAAATAGALPNASTLIPQQTLVAGAGPLAAGDKHNGSADAAARAAATVPDTHALPSINTARVLQTMDGSEMRVGMHSADLGNVSVSTLLNRQSLAAQISFEHMDLGKALTAHLPSIQAKLSSEYGVDAKVEVRDQSMGAPADNGRGERGRGGGGNTAQTTNAAAAASSRFTQNLNEGIAGSGIAGALTESLRLDVQA